MVEGSNFENSRHQSEITAENVGTWQESIVNHEQENSPKLELDVKAQAEFASLVKNLITDNKPAVVAVIRCWNKNSQQMQELQTRIEEMKKSLPELAGVLIAINAAGDKDTMTSKAVESLPPSAVPFMAIPVHGYSWTAGLNGPAALLHEALRNKPEILTKTEIANISFDAEIPPSSLEAIHKAVANGKPALSLRIEESVTNQAQAKMIGEEYHDEIQKLFSRVVKLITDPAISSEDINKAIEISGKAMAVLGRNTNLYSPLADIAKVGGFDPACNKLGGMEDHDFLWRYCFMNDGELKKIGAEPLTQKVYREAALNPTLFQDSAWNAMGADKQESRDFKYGHEITALQAIIKRLAKMVKDPGSASFTVPNKERDFKF